jgi:hypothetical protein
MDSCMPAPVCKSSDYDFTNMNGFIENTDYLGDPSTGNWVFSGDPLMYNNEAVLLTMTSDSSGTLLSSTRYVWYGKMSATMKTSRGAGVVTAFIMMSDVKDEIDFEFIGTDVQTAQSNYYFQGITDCKSRQVTAHAFTWANTIPDGNEKNLSSPNTDSQWHTYTIDWQPDSLSWEVDGQVLRTLYRNETYNETAGQYHYPQTPSRVQFSLWPAGKAGNAQGTIEWAGGEIDWNSPYMQNGYYYAMVKDVVSSNLFLIIIFTILTKFDRLLIAITLLLVTTTRATRLTGMRTSSAPTTQLSLATTVPSCPPSLPLVRIPRRVPARVRRPLRPRVEASRPLHLPQPLNPRPSLVFLVAVHANQVVMLLVDLHLLVTVVRRALQDHQDHQTRAPTQEALARSHKVSRLVAAPTMVAEWLQAALLRLLRSLLLP